MNVICIEAYLWEKSSAPPVSKTILVNKPIQNNITVRNSTREILVELILYNDQISLYRPLSWILNFVLSVPKMKADSKQANANTLVFDSIKTRA